MALFGSKKSPFEKLLDDYKNLPEEDKKKFHAEILDVEKAEDEREIDKVEEEKAESPEVKDEKAEEVKEESEEIGEKVDETEDLDEKDEDKEEEVDDETKEELEEEVEEAKDSKFDALMEEFETYKAKVDKIYARLEDVDKPAESVGLGGHKAVETEEDDENLSAREYAMKHARY